MRQEPCCALPITTACRAPTVVPAAAKRLGGGGSQIMRKEWTLQDDACMPSRLVLLRIFAGSLRLPMFRSERFLQTRSQSDTIRRESILQTWRECRPDLWHTKTVHELPRLNRPQLGQGTCRGAKRPSPRPRLLSPAYNVPSSSHARHLPLAIFNRSDLVSGHLTCLSVTLTSRTGSFGALGRLVSSPAAGPTYGVPGSPGRGGTAVPTE